MDDSTKTPELPVTNEIAAADELMPGIAAAEERISVASNWTLVWWRFKKHRLALFCAGLLIVFYLIVLFPDFFATQDPEYTEARLAFIPAQGLNLFDGWRFSPWSPSVTGKRNPITVEKCLPLLVPFGPVCHHHLADSRTRQGTAQCRKPLS